MAVLTEEEWRELFKDCETDKEKCRVILEHISGYGTEYGFNQDEDAEDLADAFAAMQPQRLGS